VSKQNEGKDLGADNFGFALRSCQETVQSVPKFFGVLQRRWKARYQKIFGKCQQHRDMQGKSKKEGLQILRSAEWS
jgi:hypothetical protein